MDRSNLVSLSMDDVPPCSVSPPVPTIGFVWMVGISLLSLWIVHRCMRPTPDAALIAAMLHSIELNKKILDQYKHGLENAMTQEMFNAWVEDREDETEQQTATRNRLLTDLGYFRRYLFRLTPPTSSSRMRFEMLLRYTPMNAYTPPTLEPFLSGFLTSAVVSLTPYEERYTLETTQNLELRLPDPRGITATILPNSPDELPQHLVVEGSNDEGETWTPLFEGNCAKADPFTTFSTRL